MFPARKPAVRALGLPLIIAIVSVMPAQLRAESRTTTSKVTVRKRAGEKAPAVAVLPVGTQVEVVREEGRWVVVRVPAGVGYVTRSTLSLPLKAVPDAAPVPVWSAARRASGALVTELRVEVTAASAALREGRDAGPVIATLANGTRLAVIDAKADPAWVHVRDDQGHAGWLARADVGDPAELAATVLPAADGARPVAGAAETTAAASAAPIVRAPPRSLAFHADAGMGLRALGMDLSSNTAGGLSNYLVDADAAALTLAVTAVWRPSGPWLVGADLGVVASYASPGIDYPGPSSTAGEIPFRTVATSLGVRGGRRFGALDLALRLGGHYDAFLANDVDNAGSIPRERLAGATIGVRFDLRPPTSRFGAAIRTDVMIVGGRAQTVGLEDGTSSTARAAWGGMTLDVALTQRWTVFGAIDFARMSTTWSGMSVRQPGATSTRRVDRSQLLQLGVGAAF